MIETMLDKHFSNKDKQRSLSLDIATGPGFLAKHMAGYFQQSIGTDLSIE